MDIQNLAYQLKYDLCISYENLSSDEEEPIYINPADNDEMEDWAT